MIYCNKTEDDVEEAFAVGFAACFQTITGKDVLLSWDEIKENVTHKAYCEYRDLLKQKNEMRKSMD